MEVHFKTLKRQVQKVIIINKNIGKEIKWQIIFIINMEFIYGVERKIPLEDEQQGQKTENPEGPYWKMSDWCLQYGGE